MKHRCAGLTAGILCLAAALRAAQAGPEFEFVSVRPAAPVSAAPASAAPVAGTSAAARRLMVLPGGRFEARGHTLEDLARVAFGFEAGPARGLVENRIFWVSNDRFDITATAGHPWTTPPPGTTVPAELRTMLRALIEDRFALKVRIATKNEKVTALRLAKPEVLGPGLRPSAAVCRGPFTEVSPGEAPPRPRCPFTNDSDRIQAEGVTMADVAQLVAQIRILPSSLPFVDQTGLPGMYDLSFSMPWRKVGDDSSSTRRMTYSSDVTREIEAQLGLKLVGARAPIPRLIIERARKPRED